MMQRGSSAALGEHSQVQAVQCVVEHHARVRVPRIARLEKQRGVSEGGGSGGSGGRQAGWRTMSSASISMIFESGMPSRLTERYMDSVLATWR
jgi:hypothetical protein